MPRIKCLHSDFEVDEVPLYPPCGEGEHTFLWIEKRGIDTEAVVRDLERELRVDRLAIGYAGRKDRLAVTRQWVSVPRVEPGVARTLAGQSWRVLEAVPHRHKLRTGDLLGNRFRVVVRDVSAPSAIAVAQERLGEIARRGLPNRFGRQRFGRDGDNAAAGAAILRGDGAGGGHRGRGRGRGDRRHLRFLVSALQSEVFNRVLERRPKPPWELLDGDLAMLHRSGGLFLVADAASEAERVASLEISPTGPIFGAKMRQPAGAVRELEDAVWGELVMPSWDDLELPRGLHVDGARRALRVPVGGASIEQRGDDAQVGSSAGAALELRFELPAGSYATVLVEEIFAGETIEEGPAEAGAGPGVGADVMAGRAGDETAE